MTPCLRRQLSPREREIAELIGDGHSYREVAGRLGISLNTVRSHVNAMARKIDLYEDRALEPRMQVFTLVMWERWLLSHSA